MKKLSVTFRGYAGHFCGSHKCLFRLNTLVEYKHKKIVISTVGLYCLNFDRRNFETLDAARNYFETKVFWAKEDAKFKDSDVTKEIYYDTELPKYTKPDMELEANEGHYKVIEEISNKLLSGEL